MINALVCLPIILTSIFGEVYLYHLLEVAPLPDFVTLLYDVSAVVATVKPLSLVHPFVNFLESFNKFLPPSSISPTSFNFTTVNYTVKQLELLYKANKCIVGGVSMIDMLDAKKDRLQEIKIQIIKYANRKNWGMVSLLRHEERQLKENIKKIEAIRNKVSKPQ